MRLDELQTMSEIQFEFLIQKIFTNLNYTVISTNRTKDKGVEVIADKYESEKNQWLRFVIYVERNKNSIISDKLKELDSRTKLFQGHYSIFFILTDFNKETLPDVKSDNQNIIIKNKDEFYNILKSAGILDCDNNLQFVYSPNSEENRRFLITNIIKTNQPKSLSILEITKKMRGEYYVTVSDTQIGTDVEKLVEDGHLAILDECYCYIPKISEIQIILNDLESFINSVDYFFNDENVYEWIEELYSINIQVVKRYLVSQIRSLLDRLCNFNIISSVDGQRYSTQLAFEKFRESNLTVEQLEANINKAFEIDENSKNTLIKDTKFYPKDDSIYSIFGIGENGEKLLPFVEIICFKCSKCSELHMYIIETFCLHVTSSEINYKISRALNKELIYERLKETGNQFAMSKIFTLRLSENIDRYFGNTDEVDIDFYNDNTLLIRIKIDIDKDSQLSILSSRILDMSKKFQSFINSTYAPIEGFGKPSSVERIKPRFARIEWEEESE